MSDYIEVDGLRIGPNRYRYLAEQLKEANKKIVQLENAVEDLRTAGNRVISYNHPLNEWTMAVQNALYPEQAERLSQKSRDGDQ